ncbi:hypothetical protein BJ878DRAFT_423687 [Calycina marina]|uniref:Arrestin-like N-terminal domain-containing protein n=1 Tax=Calycina marina TaxID=1763456 RepID=A0A9P7Z199_9HELO|nr:hypothetical protein BJ878DRAFT_423687 [Calycina marina]
MHYASLYGATLNSTGTAGIGFTSRALALTTKPETKLEVEIDMKHHNDDTVYTTFDSITGNVNITAPSTSRFDEVRITFEGSTKTYVENLSPHSSKSRTTALHTFLKLTMPVRESDYPQPPVVEAGKTHTFPFNFAVPAQLLPHACNHTCSTDHVHEAHLQLPPSMGKIVDKDYVYDDMAPEMTKIKYAVKVRVIRQGDSDENEMTLAEAAKTLRVIPRVAEAPPLSVTNEDDYVLSKTKSLRKGMFSGKLGKITVSSAQPRAIVLPAPSPERAAPKTTVATVDLRFDPHDAASDPPRLGGLTTKLKIASFFFVQTAEDFPTRSSMMFSMEAARGVFKSTVPISSLCVEAVTWHKHTAPFRRNSDWSSCSSDCSESGPGDAQKPYYTATILAPINLPMKKRFLPTFHSCIASRTYAIDMTLSIHTPGTGVPAYSVSLHVPVQIAADGNKTALAELTAAEAAQELQEADEFFRPRVLSIPNEERIGNSVLPGALTDLPPSYEDYSLLATMVDPGRS